LTVGVQGGDKTGLREWGTWAREWGGVRKGGEKIRAEKVPLNRGREVRSVRGVGGWGVGGWGWEGRSQTPAKLAHNSRGFGWGATCVLHERKPGGPESAFKRKPSSSQPPSLRVRGERSMKRKNIGTQGTEKSGKQRMMKETGTSSKGTIRHTRKGQKNTKKEGGGGQEGLA